MYIDEVGNADLKNTQDENQRFLSLSGVILSLLHIKDFLNPKIEMLKMKYFDSHPDEPIIFHRKEILNAKNPFQNLKDQSIRENFNKELLHLFEDCDFTLITVVIDKKEHNKQYYTVQDDPYHYCLAAIIERYLHFLERNNFIGDVMTESRGGKEDLRLKKSFKKLYNEGTQFIQKEKFESFLTSHELKIKLKSNNISGLQLCDLVAHPSRREILLENNKIIDSRTDIFAEKICNTLKSKYDKLHGKKMLP